MSGSPDAGTGVTDGALARAIRVMSGTKPGVPCVATFFDEATFTATHVVSDPVQGSAAIVDSVLDFDHAAGRTSTIAADRVIAYIRERGLKVEWILETHVHADHLSAAVYLHHELGGRIAIGRDITTVQSLFGEVYQEDGRFARDGTQFDHLFSDGDTFRVGDVEAIALAVPGHTPADICFVIGDAAFVGDTLFMPDSGTARADFPGGDARRLYRSIRRLLSLPDSARLFLCHDYKAAGRSEFSWETTVGVQRVENIHVRDAVDEDAFVQMREARDATLGMPRLILPSIQVNMRAGHLPEGDQPGTHLLRLPLNQL